MPGTGRLLGISHVIRKLKCGSLQQLTSSLLIRSVGEWMLRPGQYLHDEPLLHFPIQYIACWLLYRQNMEERGLPVSPTSVFT